MLVINDCYTLLCFLGHHLRCLVLTSHFSKFFKFCVDVCVDYCMIDSLVCRVYEMVSMRWCILQRKNENEETERVLAKLVDRPTRQCTR